MENTNRKTRQDYVSGSAARQLATQPQRQPQRQPQGQPVRRTDESVRINERRSSKQNKEKAKVMNPGYVIFLSVMTITMFVVLSYYMQLHFQANVQMHKIVSLESQVAELKLDNDARYMRAQGKIPLTTIRQRATTELAMIYPAENQIVYYNVDKADFMEQYEDIPNSGDQTLLGRIFGH